MKRREFFKFLLGGTATALIPTVVLKTVAPEPKPEYAAYTIPGIKEIPKHSIIPTFDTSQAVDWQISRCSDARWDVVARAMDIMQKDFEKRANDDTWRKLMCFDGDLIGHAYDVQALPTRKT